MNILGKAKGPHAMPAQKNALEKSFLRQINPTLPHNYRPCNWVFPLV